jgi:hypothetical protein
LNYQYNADVQYSFGSGTILDIGYSGSHQIHQGRNRDINQAPTSDLLSIYNYENSGGSEGVNPDIVRPYLGYGHIWVNGRDGTTRYNALQTSLSRRFSKGFQMQVSYTFSRLISSTTNRDTEGHASPVQNSLDLDAEKALATQDQPHTLNINSNWELPFWKQSSNRWLKNAFGGWELNGIYTAYSGLPVSVCTDHDVIGLADGGTICQRVNVVSNPNLSSGARSVNSYFDTSAFELQAPGTFGNAGRNLIRGPGLNNFDLSLFKNFALPSIKGIGGSEGMRLQFRAEFFNAFNHTQFGGIDTNFVPDSDTAGAKASTSSPFGTVNSVRSPREIQFALKLIF